MGASASNINKLAPGFVLSAAPNPNNNATPVATNHARRNAGVATNRAINGSEEPQFHTIVCWDKLAETTSEYVKKGDPLYIEGRLQYRTYQDDEGKDRGVAEIVARDVQFLGRRRAESELDAITAEDVEA